MEVCSEWVERLSVGDRRVVVWAYFLTAPEADFRGPLVSLCVWLIASAYH